MGKTSLFILITIFCITSCERDISIKILKSPQESTPIVEPPVEPPVVPPVTPPVAPPDPIDTGASGILNYSDPICVNYRALTFDYSMMPEYDIQDNVIVSTFHGGTAEVKAIGVAEGTGTPYRTDLNPMYGCNSAWYPGGSICQFPDDTSEGVVGNNQGATWNNSSSSNLMIGYIIIDLGEVKSIVGFDVFQMYSDGKATHVQIFAHSDLTSTLPLDTDAGWTEITSGKTALGAGEVVSSLVTKPLRLPLSSTLTVRYLKVYVQNNGCLGNQSYIELKSIRGYSRTR